MEMAFMQQGGIKDDGMNKDPVSGNPIPPGSMASEVRDDIPAMLSEGEYVVPADVLRFYGVNFFENLRGQAKSGLQSMESNGRIGGEPLSPQQVQQNMGNAPVQASTGVLAGQNTGTVGYSTMQPAGSATPSVTTFKTWVHAQTNEQKIIKYINGKATTEEPESPPFYEFGSAALKKAQTQIKVDDGNGDPKTTEKPDPNAWMDGIDFSDASAMNAKVDEILGLSTGEKGVIGVAGMAAGLPGMAIGKTLVDGNSISTARALEQYTRNELGDTKTADEMKDKINSSLEKNKILGWLDKTFPGLMPGTQKYNQVIKLKQGFQTAQQEETDKILSGPGGSSSGGPGVTVTPNAGGGNTYLFDDSGLTAAQIAEEEKITDDVFADIDAQFEAAGVSQGPGTQSTLPSGATATSPDVNDINEKYSTTASNKGGLMTKAKKKK